MARPLKVADKLALQIALSLGLGLGLLLLSYLRIYGDAGSAAFGGKIIEAALAGPVWDSALGNHLIAFALTQVVVHSAFGLTCLGLAHLSRVLWPNTGHSVVTWLLLWFTLGAGWLLVANAAQFPASSLGVPYAEAVRVSWHGASIYSVYSIVMACALLWMLGSAVLRIARPLHARLPRWVLPAGAAALVLAIVAVRIPTATSSASTGKPHIILIGLDSLRADAVQRSPATMTPAIDEFLRGAVRFSNATTPLARTFPSWVSIITGRHPHTTGAVINLLPRELIKTGETLPQLLSSVGYHSIYAIDEVRFSNLDRSYGFDEMIAPPMGATDFLLGFFADAPLSNLLVNTRLGAVLFPYSYGNRAAWATYDPDTFVERLDRELHFDKPTFLAAHFTLAHWPYTWADTRIDTLSSSMEPRPAYEAAVARLDRQFSDFMRVLERHGALDNALVIILSDHGEALGNTAAAAESAAAKGDPDLPPHDEDLILGHGTSVFSPHQYRVVLAMRSFGSTPLGATAPRTIDAPVSLEDLTPTLAAVFGAHATQPFDGTSLLPLLDSGAPAPATFSERIRFTETEFNPPGFQIGQVASTSSIVRAASYYHVDPVTDRVLIRGELLGDVLDKRQYAAFRDGKLLAFVPPSVRLQQSERRLILALEGQVPAFIDDPAASADPDVVDLYTALAARFPRETVAAAAPPPTPQR